MWQDNRVPGNGPVPCGVMLIGERPGSQEAKQRKPFVGPSGQELNRYLLNNSGVDRSSVYVTNLVKTYAETPPTPEEIRRDWLALDEELVQVQPEYIGFVGVYSARAFLGPSIENDWAHGLHFPHFLSLADGRGGEVKTMVLTHPASGLHQPATASKIAWDFEQFGKLVKGLPLPAGHLSKPIPTTYSDDAVRIEDVVAMDTEGTVEEPWGLSYSCRPGVASVEHGRKHRKWDCDNLDKALVVLHGALHDLPVLAKLGVRPKRYTCTLLMAALLGVEPHGLKPLARRHCGLVMSEYDEIVAEARRDKGIEYLGRVLEYAEANATTENAAAAD